MVRKDGLVRNLLQKQHMMCILHLPVQKTRRSVTKKLNVFRLMRSFLLLVEHMVSLMKVAKKICEVYVDLDVELLLAGVFLHDIGKVRELNVEAGFVYTDEGQLLGHLVIGVEMLSEKIRQFEQLTGGSFDNELAWRLKHMIVSHHGTYEFGSPRLPMTPEAVALHQLDNLDAKLHEFFRSIQDDPNSGSHWTLYIPRLDRKIFKGAK